MALQEYNFDGPNCAQERDRATLVALYNSTGGPNWTNSDNWLSTTDLLGRLARGDDR